MISLSDGPRIFACVWWLTTKASLQAALSCVVYALLYCSSAHARVDGTKGGFAIFGML